MVNYQMIKKRLKIDSIIRGIKLVNLLMPKYIPNMVLFVVFSSIPIYTNIFFSAKIIDEVIGKCRLKYLLLYLVVMVIISIFFTLISKFGWKYVRVNQLISGDWEDSFLNQKSFTLDYEQIEDNKVRELRQQITDNREFGGLNVLVIRTTYLIKSLLNLIISFAMIVSIFKIRSVPSCRGLLAFANSSACSFILFVLTILLAVFLGYNAQKGIHLKSTKSKELSTTQKKAHFLIDEYLSDNKTGKDVRIYSQEKIIIEIIKGMLNNYSLINRQFISLQFSVDNKITVINLILNSCVYIIVSLKTIAGTFSLGVMLKYISLISQFLRNVVNLSDSIVRLQENNLYLKNLYEYLDLETKTDKNGTFHALPSDHFSTLKFINVSFKYPHHKEFALQNISFEIKKGERVAIVGKNGSGKTTLIKLLCRLYDPTEGIITLNDDNIKNYNYSDYLNAFSVVFQDYRLFPLTIGQNISASDQYDKNRVIKCCNLVGLNNFIYGLPNGLETNISKDFDENGIILSGGEAQKIAIARALYKNSSIVILNEPTSSLDPLSESEIYADFNRIIKNKTAIYISHRLSSCRFCDKIIVLDKGNIVQIGNHESLLKDKDNLYYSLWNAQAQYYNM